jgi:hypothetical protein
MISTGIGMDQGVINAIPVLPNTAIPSLMIVHHAFPGAKITFYLFMGDFFVPAGFKFMVTIFGHCFTGEREKRGGGEQGGTTQCATIFDKMSAVHPVLSSHG